MDDHYIIKKMLPKQNDYNHPVCIINTNFDYDDKNLKEETFFFVHCSHFQLFHFVLALVFFICMMMMFFFVKIWNEPI